MREKNALFGAKQKRASVLATVLFVMLSCLAGYAAMRWMGGAVVRYLSVPSEKVPLQTLVVPDVTPNASPQQEQSQSANVSVMPDSTKSETVTQKTPIPSAVPTAKPIGKEEEHVLGAGVWRDETRYRTEFSQERMDAVLFLTDARNRAEAICLLAVREDAITLVAIPASILMENGSMLDTYTAQDALKALSSLLRLEIDRHIVLPKTEFIAAVKQLGTLEVGGRQMEGVDIEIYLASTEAAPLLCAERFSQVLSSLPKAMRSLSLWQLIKIKSVLADVVDSNISEADGWMLCHAIREAQMLPIEQIVLPVESELADGNRVYRMNARLTKPILEKLYKSF